MKIDSLRFENLAFEYEEGRPVFRDLSFEVPVDDSFFVSGPIGSGQSTFLKLLAVVAQPQSGRYTINGVDTTDLSFEEFLPFRRRIGYTFDYGGLFANRTLFDNLALPLVYHKISSEADIMKRIHDLADAFKFRNQLEQRPAAVSGGLRKLACVLRSFLLDPEMIVMDDPFTGIGTEASHKLVELIADARRSRGLRHIYLTSREEVWAGRLGGQTLWLDQEKISLRETEKAA